jgi:hypothetical protein
MSTMLPSYISETTKSDAEKQIYSWFQHDSRTKDWFVLHSVGIAEHIKYVYGEIDFIVLAPNYGFFYLEVKGGRIQIRNGVWIFTDRNGKSSESSRGPFQQVEEGFFSIREYLKARLDKKHQFVLSCVSGVGVMFPDVQYSTVGTDDAIEMVLDASYNGDVFRYISNLADYTESKMRAKHLRPFRPTIQDVHIVKDVLRGDYSFDFSMIANKRLSLDKLNEITKQQSIALSLIQNNNQCLFYGHAGTGKTYLAIETAKRLQRQGLDVGFFCYNNALGRWLCHVLKDEDIKPIYVGTLHSFVVNILHPKEESISDWKGLVADGIKLISENPIKKFDAIVIDEAQDLASPTYMLFFSLIITNGIDNGKIYMFGDFVNQSIYEASIPDYEKVNLLKLAAKNLVMYPLNINCRNTNNIHKLVSYAYNIDEQNWMMSNINGPNYEMIIYEHNAVKNIISNLLKEGVNPKNITVLSPFSKECSVTYTELMQNFTIKQYSPDETKIVFSTIQSFKGLENDYIIVCDVDETNFNETLYVALTRARYALYIVGTKVLFKRMLKFYV